MTLRVPAQNRGQTDVCEILMRRSEMRTNKIILIISSITGLEHDRVRTE